MSTLESVLRALGHDEEFINLNTKVSDVEAEVVLKLFNEKSDF